jgi:hypothetical protein
LIVEESLLLQQVEILKSLKSRIDDMIQAVVSASTTNYAEEADRYRRLELLLPSVINYCQELDKVLKKVDDLQRKKDDLRGRVLERQTDLPLWWNG